MVGLDLYCPRAGALRISGAGRTRYHMETDLVGVLAFSKSEAWAAGNSGTIQKWNGKEWSRVSTNAKGQLGPVSGSGSDDIWLSANPDFLHWDGLSWSSVTWTPEIAGPIDSQYATLHCVLTKSDAWATGWAVKRTGQTEYFVLRWNGTQWKTQATAKDHVWGAIWASGPQDAWSLGPAGTIYHWDGTSWASISSGTTEYLRGIWGTSSTDAWAVGDNGAIVHWNGATWTQTPTGTREILSGIWAAGPRDVWAVGFGGTLLRFNNTT